jgi:anti-sigma factor RsiW
MLQPAGISANAASERCRGKTMTTHDLYEDLAAAAIDFELTAVDQATLDRHLDACAACQAAAAAYRADAAVLRAMASRARRPVPSGSEPR